MLPLPLRGLELAISVGSNLGLLILGVVLIILGVMLPKPIPQGALAWTILLIIGVICVVVWIILLLAGIIISI